VLGKKPQGVNGVIMSVVDDSGGFVGRCGVVAKFKCYGVSFCQSSVLVAGKYVGKLCRKVNLQAVGADTTENSRFFTATPCGTIEMLIGNEAAAEDFEIEGEYEVHFVKVKPGNRIEIRHLPIEATPEKKTQAYEPLHETMAN
jgi:hypothetical protein